MLARASNDKPTSWPRKVWLRSKTIRLIDELDS